MVAETQQDARDGDILVFGRSGQLARALRRSLAARRAPHRAVGREGCDLTHAPEGCSKLIAGARAVINASGYTAVDAAETHGPANRALNATAPGSLATLCARAGVPFVHVSTDYVFAGDAQTPYRPDSPTAPLNAYGRAKLAGERAVRAARGNSLILRTSWVYDGTGRNFLTTMLRIGREHGTVRVVDDQIGRPTYAGHLAEAVLCALDRGWTGTRLHHVQNTGAPVSWAGFARAIFQGAGMDAGVTPIPTADYPTPAARPAYSVLDVAGFEGAFAHPLEDWRTGLALALAERGLAERGLAERSLAERDVAERN